MIAVLRRPRANAGHPGATSRVTVGIGLLPVPLRNVALTAMEIATMARLFPGAP